MTDHARALDEATERPAAERPLLASLPEDWAALMAELGERPYRAQQICRWVFEQGVMDPQQMTNLSKGLRGQLAERGLAAPLKVQRVVRSRDNTRKLLLELDDGAVVECVLIPMTRETEDDADGAAATDDDGDGDGYRDHDRDDDRDRDRHGRFGSEPGADDESGAELVEASGVLSRRVTLCVSTQVGCAMGCVFCASGRAGLQRGLRAHEVLAQVLVARGYLDPGEKLRNLVFMGMGEPLHHYEETAHALRLLTDPSGGGMSPRRITVSTVGLVPGIRRLGQDFGGKIGLAISLHAPSDEVRSRLMPINRRYATDTLLAALRSYPLPRRRRITIEYTLIAGVNDALAQATALAQRLRGLRVKVNLIPMNPVQGAGLGPPADARVEAFRAELARRGLSCSVRRRRGDDVDAACGQLALVERLVPAARLVQ